MEIYRFMGRVHAGQLAGAAAMGAVFVFCLVALFSIFLL